MKVRAKMSFSGVCTMVRGEVREIGENSLLSDLLSAGYVEQAEEAEKAKQEENNGSEKKKSRRKKEKDAAQ